VMASYLVSSWSPWWAWEGVGRRNASARWKSNLRSLAEPPQRLDRVLPPTANIKMLARPLGAIPVRVEIAARSQSRRNSILPCVRRIVRLW
jgi:hypothetical protein